MQTIQKKGKAMAEIQDIPLASQLAVVIGCKVSEFEMKQ